MTLNVLIIILRGLPVLLFTGKKSFYQFSIFKQILLNQSVLYLIKAVENFNDVFNLNETQNLHFIQSHQIIIKSAISESIINLPIYIKPHIVLQWHLS